MCMGTAGVGTLSLSLPRRRGCSESLVPRHWRTRFLLPHLPDFLARHPAVSLELQISDRYAGLVDEGVEVAIRIGHLEDSALRARRVALFKRVCVASRDYLAVHGAPKTPDDLRSHQCVIYTLSSPRAAPGDSMTPRCQSPGACGLVRLRRSVMQ
ncbi:LysR substrate-binding domain-containing protein [Luteibacter aegosomatissinici]|uniref:LysR substrate-binding domain-containing protein n=1 Tax=Luteibacter aegosomatissinici TaxID=2911539 RepID=UPI0031B88CCF